MGFTYSGNPSASDLDAVRFSVGDTDMDNPLFQDAELTWLVTMHGSVSSALAVALEQLAIRFSRQADKAVGDLRISLSQKAAAYAARAATAREISLIDATYLGIPYAGGISAGDVQTVSGDTDRVKPAFVKGHDDYLFVRDDEDD